MSRNLLPSSQSVNASGQGLAVARNLFSDDDDDIDNLTNLGQLHHRVGKFDDAVVCFQRAVDLDTQLNGPEHIR